MKNYPKIAKDLFSVQMSWTYGFLVVMFIINIIKGAVNFIQGTEVDGGFYYSLLIASNIYMLVIGIIAIYFLPYFVENGVTRKDAFLGTVFSSIGVAIAIPVITYLVSIAERFILSNLFGLTYKVHEMNEVVLDIDGNIIGELVLSVVLAPYIEPQTNWILALIVFAVNIFIFYILGLLISTGFYVGGTLTGLGFIIVAFIFNIIKDTLLRISLGLPLSERLVGIDSLPLGVAILGILLVIFISVWIIRMMTRRVPIKM